ncbi:mobile element protein [Gracilibacillus boraciitolerans JCM 21714]|uniref:Mobile element protein n=1 Tax=Gracilibacillus boraciitolerans JCM 21714 TaxID=1298598 RepID=W4VQP6_9BACI|nr:mobile element protein [Gracilibacillus boraciitolerans JCM 21714]
MFQSQLDRIQFLEDLSILETIFLRRAERKVKQDGTITLEKQLYEVPSEYIGQRIEVRMDHQHVYIFEDGKKVAKAVAVSMHDNAHVKRRLSPPFALSEEKQQEGEKHV